jgi:NRAMP (natural resistance-associated macrophage protein)-like metal ion transporter
MKEKLLVRKPRSAFSRILRMAAIFITVFGPATITAMADNDAGGVATYSIAGATLGYPILFILIPITILLALTQEMGMRLAIITRRGLADLIRENYGVKVSLFIFACLMLANLGTLVTELSAIKTTSAMFNLPSTPVVIGMVLVALLVILRGSYKVTQNIMLVASFFYVAYLIGAIKAKPDWGLAVSNLFFPHGVDFTPDYMRSYLLIGMGVLGTTITPWGQFFISSFAFDKKIEKGKVNFAQLETYWGAFLTDFFSFFMIVATAATLFVNGIPLVSGEQAALAIEPFAGHLAGTLFALGIMNAGFMGLVVVSLSGAYAFAEFFGLSGSLDSSFQESKTFYLLFGIQLLVATLIALFPGVTLFQLAVATQTLNAMMLPFVFFYLIRLTNNRKLMGDFVNNKYQKWIAIVSTIIIVIASAVTVVITIMGSGS